MSARVPECQKIKTDGLNQYGAECSGRVIFATIRKTVGLKGLVHYTDESQTGNVCSNEAHLVGQISLCLVDHPVWTEQ